MKSDGERVMKRPVLRTGLSAICNLQSAITALMLICAASLADDAEFASRVREDTKWLTSYGTRQIGTAAHARLQDDLLKKIKEIPNVRVWTHEFPVVVPVTEEAVLEIKDGELAGRHDIFALWPDVSRLNTTTPDGISGKLVYIGDAAYENIPATSLRGNIAVMEMSAYVNYRRAFDFGAAAVLFVESKEVAEPLHSSQSLYKPRYYVPAGTLADELRDGSIAEGRIVCRGKWKTVTARNIYVGVKPEDASEVTPYAIVAAYDSMSRVMGIAPGADAAVDCATVLKILRDEAARPTRSIIFGFVDAYHIDQLGMRYMSAMLTVTPDGRTRQDYDEIEQKDLEEYQDAADELEQFKTADEGLASLHDRYKCKHLRRLFKDAVGPQLLDLKELQGEVRLAKKRREEEKKPDVLLRMLGGVEDAAEELLASYSDELLKDEPVEEPVDEKELCKQAVEFVAASRPKVGDEAPLDIFRQAKVYASQLLPVCSRLLIERNRILAASYSESTDIKEGSLPLARELWHQMSQRVEGQLAEQKERIAFFDPLDKLRGEMVQYFMPGAEGAPESLRACDFVIGIDLSDCGILCAPGRYCFYNRIDTVDRDFDRALKRAVKGGELWPEGSPYRRVVNIDAIEGNLGGIEKTDHRAMISSAAGSFQLAGVTWNTDDAPRQKVDSPLDTYAALDWERIEPQLPATLIFLKWALTTKDFDIKTRPVNDTAAKWRNGMGRIVDVSAGETVPRVPRSGFLVTLVGNRTDVDGIRCNEFAWSGEDGSFRMPILCADINRWIMNFNVSATMLDENGAIVEALTTTESLVTARLATTFNLGTKPGDQLPRAVTFDCAELNGPTLFDARFLEPLTQPLLQDTVRGGSPKQSHFSVDNSGQMWGLVEPDIKWQLIMKAGAGRVRMALLNAMEDGREKGYSLRETFQRGFTLNEPLSSVPAYVSARDLSVLNAWRLADFGTAGIESEKIDDIRDGTKEFLKEADDAMKADDGGALQRASVEALANEIRAYQAVKDVGLDVARGAIFLMLMLVPFCVAMERLLFACARIGKQIAASVAIFTIMTLLLWSFHPAFRISAQPLVIVMAFTILAMSVIVISMVLNRFKGSVREFQSSLAEGSGAKMGRGGVLGSAVFLGIANMRKRKVRTLLTGATIVLVTFALLCFSSTSSYIDKKDFRLEGVKASRPAVLIRRPSFGVIRWEAAPSVHNLLGAEDVSVGERVWFAGGRGQATWRLYVIDPDTGERVGLRGALGLPKFEDELTSVDNVLPNWKDFAEQGGCYLSKDTASLMGVEEGETVVVRGLELVVRGIFDPIRLEDEITLLDGQRITPYDYAQLEQDWVARDTQDAIEQETGSVAAMMPEGSDADRYIPAQELIIVPSDVARKMGGGLHSFGIACSSKEQAAEVANRLTKTIVFPAYYSNKEGGVNVLVSTPLIAVPPKNLAIPLIVAALIIFTTMLNSVSERKGEIYVYTSLGLAPTHVAALFVAEALTYGLMGAVFGYISGQGTAAVLTKLGMMEGVTLNYSGTAVIKTMLLVQGVVVASAIVPAIVAGKIAAPSTEMDWRVPQPVDGVINDSLPFTVSPSAAAGLVAFIHEYLEAHKGGVLGAFDVDGIEVLQPGDGGCVVGLEARLWLEPYDMGVRQRMRLYVEKPDDGACSISVAITHEAGTPKMWWRLNKPFFFDLRRQLLGWRKLSMERVQQYVDSAERGVRSAG